MMEVRYDPSQSSQREFVPAPAGMHVAVLVDVIDEGIRQQTWEGRTKPVHKCRLVWQLSMTIPQEPGDEYPARRFTVSKMYTVSLHPKARLRQDLESWRGKPYRDDEVVSVELEKLVGKTAMLQIQHKDGTYRGRDTTFANVTAILPTNDKLDPEGYTRVRDRRADESAEVEDDGADEYDVPF